MEADLFSWRPDRRYDAVFFGFWISHVPPDRFEVFWSLVDDALAPGGEVFFFDDSHRPDVELIEGEDSTIVERRLTDGTTFRVVKVPYEASALEERLRSLGWNVDVTPTPGPFYWASGSPLGAVAMLMLPAPAGREPRPPPFRRSATPATPVPPVGSRHSRGAWPAEPDQRVRPTGRTVTGRLVMAQNERRRAANRAGSTRCG